MVQAAIVLSRAPANGRRARPLHLISASTNCMESPIVTRLFRRLASHRFCHDFKHTRRTIAPLHARLRSTNTRNNVKTTVESDWQQRTDHFPQDKLDEFKKYPNVTSDSLRGRRERPRRVKMLMRDFIEDSLYNPNYGYFSKHATIFSPGAPFDFSSIRDEPEFNKLLGQRYTEFEDKLDEKQFDEARQLWHTPTELFRPFYGEAIARYMVANYKLSLYPYHDLVIYELGAGNGTLMLNILDYIRQTDAEVYARTKFRIIEVSNALAKLQMRNLQATAANCQQWRKTQW